MICSLLLDLGVDREELVRRLEHLQEVHAKEQADIIKGLSNVLLIFLDDLRSQ